MKAQRQWGNAFQLLKKTSFPTGILYSTKLSNVNTNKIFSVLKFSKMFPSIHHFLRSQCAQGKWKNKARNGKELGKGSFNRVAKQRKSPRMLANRLTQGRVIRYQSRSKDCRKDFSKNEFDKIPDAAKVLLSRQLLESVNWINAKYGNLKSVKKEASI